MNKMRRSRAIFIQSPILLALLVAIPGVVFAQGSSAGIPENARAMSFGSGWECDRGYRKANGGDTTCNEGLGPPIRGYSLDKQ